MSVKVKQWKPQIGEGETLTFEHCKGGYFSTLDDYALKVVGKTARTGTPTPDNPIEPQCVKAGTKVWCGGKNLFNPKNIVSKQFTFNGDEIIIPPTLGNGYIGTNTKLKSLCPSLKVGDVVTLSAIKRQDDGVTSSDFIYLNAPYFRSWKFWVALTITEKMLESDIVLYGCNISGGSASGKVYLKLQIEYGSTTTEYEPYCGNTITLPVDLNSGDVYFPITGKIIRADNTIEQFTPTPIYAPQGTVQVTSVPMDLTPTLQATMLVRR